MNSIDILVLGHLERNTDGSVRSGDTWSTSALVRTGDGHNIVVDTSADFMMPAVKTSLRQIGRVFPEDIDIIVLTHTHGDHTGNNGLFRNAKIYVHENEKCPMPGAVEIGKETVIAEGVRIVPTPGHTEGSVSVFVDSDKHYAIVGDAIPLRDNYLRKKVPALNTDPEQAKESMAKIIAYADVIVPGHDRPFTVGKN